MAPQLIKRHHSTTSGCNGVSSSEDNYLVKERKKTHRQTYRWIDTILVVGWFLPTFWLDQGETSHKTAETLLTYSPLNFSHM